MRNPQYYEAVAQGLKLGDSDAYINNNTAISGPVWLQLVIPATVEPFVLVSKTVELRHYQRPYCS